jgi:chemotaxis protein MotB
MHRHALIIAIAWAAGCGGKPAPQAPKQDDRVATLEAELAKTKHDLTDERAAADELRKREAEKAAEAQQLQDKLAEVVGQAGEVTTADGAVKLELVDQILFPVGEAELTPKGKEVLAKVGAALQDVDKQIWVQGHTDDTPIVAPQKKKVVKKKGKAKEEPEQPEVRFASNWELSAARALQVVHYLQDHGKIDPTKLAALAFGEYRPVSKYNKAANRRIEIVLYPHRAVIERRKKR